MGVNMGQAAALRKCPLPAGDAIRVHTLSIIPCEHIATVLPSISVEKLKAYIEETRHYVLPLLRKVKNQYPEDSDILFVLKYHIVSVVDSIDATIQVFEAEK